MERLRQVWLATRSPLTSRPRWNSFPAMTTWRVLKHVTDPVEITARFVEYVTGSAPILRPKSWSATSSRSSAAGEGTVDALAHAATGRHRSLRPTQHVDFGQADPK